MLDALLQPRTIAVVGASRTPGKVGYELVANLVSGGFKGRIIPINPTADRILDLPCFPSVSDAGGGVDLAILAVPTAQVMPVVEDCIIAGVKALVVLTAGFKETGHEGAELETLLATRCRAAGISLLGPNCLGLINAHHHMNASFAKRMPQPGGISVISQSGALCTAILDWAAHRQVGLAKVISMGNKAHLSEIEFLQALAKDPETKVIVGYLESIGSGDAFMKAAEAAATLKPVVVLKAGITQAGVKAASSHTGSLAGADIAYGAAFRRAGVIRADTFESLFDYATALAMQPMPMGRRVAIITNAGGPGIMAADAAEGAGMSVGTLSGGVATALRQRLPAAASVGNPIDVLGDADPERYVMALKAAQEDSTVDGVVIILTPQAMTRPADTARAIAKAADGRKPVVASFMGGEDVSSGRVELLAAGIPEYPAPERAVAALRAMCEYSEWLRRPPRLITRFPVNRRRVERIIQRHQRSGRLNVGEASAKDILRAYDITVPRGQLGANAEEAIEIAEDVGYPVAIKIASPDILHKSDVGGVKLNLNTPDAVRDAVDLMMLRIHQRMPEARIEGVYVEQMGKPGREVILGMNRDPQFGPMLMFGLGGIFVEVMKDVTFHIAPITEEEALRMLEGTRSFSLLRGVRGQARVDIAAIASTLQRISQLVTDYPQIIEMDINPFIVGQVGRISVAADARITLAPEAQAGRP